jgi:hypothetical protein
VRTRVPWRSWKPGVLPPTTTARPAGTSPGRRRAPSLGAPLSGYLLPEFPPLEGTSARLPAFAAERVAAASAYAAAAPFATRQGGSRTGARTGAQGAEAVSPHEKDDLSGATTPPHTREVAGSIPALPTMTCHQRRTPMGSTCDGLENRFGGSPPTGVSNPPLRHSRVVERDPGLMGRFLAFPPSPVESRRSWRPLARATGARGSARGDRPGDDSKGPCCGHRRRPLPSLAGSHHFCTGRRAD